MQPACLSHQTYHKPIVQSASSQSSVQPFVCMPVQSMAIIQGWPGSLTHCIWHDVSLLGSQCIMQFLSGHCFILQARWVHFIETGSHPVLCLLQSTLLTIYTLEGEVHSVPLAYNFTQVWPLPRGLLLAVRHIAHFVLVPIASCCVCPSKLAWCLHTLLET